jgi:cytochrome c oxidase subunit 2
MGCCGAQRDFTNERSKDVEEHTARARGAAALSPMNPHTVLVVLIVLGGVWTACWAAVLVSSRRTVPFERIEKSETRLRITLLTGFALVAIALFVLTLRRLPFRESRVARVGAPRTTVTVTGMQWSWALSTRQLPVGVPVEFAVGSRDVNHDFAIYDSHGRLLAQVQGMPGYTNHLVYVFPAVGEYTVRCLEYCGLGHHTMSATITATDR